MLYHFPIIHILKSKAVYKIGTKGLKMKLHPLDQTRRGETDICDSFVKYRCCFPWRMPGIRCITIFWSKVKSENVGTASERAATTQHFPKTKASSSMSCSITTSACRSSNLTHQCLCGLRQLDPSARRARIRSSLKIRQRCFTGTDSLRPLVLMFGS